MNRHYIIGNLTRDPESGNTNGGTFYCRFMVAVNRRYKREGGPEADFMRVTTFGGLAETCKKYLAKGKKVAVIGESEANGWIGRDGKARAQIEITAREVEFLSSGPRSGLNDPPEDPAWMDRQDDAGEMAAGTEDGGQQVSYTEVQTPEDLPY